MAKIHGLEGEVERSNTSLSEDISADTEKIRRDMAIVRTSLEKEYQQ